MRSEKWFVGALLMGFTLGLGSLPAQAGDDLTTPPDFRTPAAADPAVPDKPAAAQPAKPKKAPVSKPDATKAEKKPKAPVSADKADPITAAKAEKPSGKGKDDDPLSFGMKWNATDQTNGGPGSLSDELNKNINGAAVGTGAEVGFKYKF